MADQRENKFDVAMSKTARQAVPDPSLGNDGMFDASSKLTGEKELLAQGTGDEGLTDDEYPGPLPPGTGAAVVTADGQHDMNMGSVAPYKYPDYGDWPQKKTGWVLTPGIE